MTEISYLVQVFFEMFPSKKKPVSLDSEKQNIERVYQHLETVLCAGKSQAVVYLQSTYMIGKIFQFLRSIILLGLIGLHPMGLCEPFNFSPDFLKSGFLCKLFLSYSSILSFH